MFKVSPSLRNSHLAGASIVAAISRARTSATTDALEPKTAEVVVEELRNHATRRSGSRVFRTSLEARSEVEKKTALVYRDGSLKPLRGVKGCVPESCSFLSYVETLKH